MMILRFLIVIAVLISGLIVPVVAADGEKAKKVQPLPGTKPLTLKGDIASHLVDGVDKFLLRKLSESVAKRKKDWSRDFSSAYSSNKRKRLAHMLGIRDQRIAFDAPELVATTNRSALVGKGDGFEVYAVRWPVLGNPGPNGNGTASVHGEGLLLVPKNNKKPLANILAIPDADQTPEQIVGLTKGVPEDSQFARRLAESGCRVLVPMLISREMKKRNGRANLTNREYLYRSAFVLGRHLIGYEVQKVLAGVDWFTKDAGDANPKIGVIGYGEGGMLALYAGALDTRIDATCVSGYFDSRQNIWREPLDRNVFGLLREFGDAELASLITPRLIHIEINGGPELTLPGEGGAPARIVSPKRSDVLAEYQRIDGRRRAGSGISYQNQDGTGAFCNRHTVHRLLRDLGVSKEPLVELQPLPPPPQNLNEGFEPDRRQQRQLDEIDRHNQLLLRESPFVRKQFMSNLDTSSVEKYKQSVEQYRRIFAEDVIGKFDDKLLPFNPRTRKAYDEQTWTGYEVVLDVFPDVIAYGVLLVPKDIKEGEKRPVVVCQHGLEGRPQDIISGNHRAYHDFAAKLAERGFITFAPQNLYLFKDRFRTLQRKANPLGKTLYSVIVPQHQQIVDWLQSLPYVDPDRVAFYGLSYGGKTAMRVPALVTDYCLSICSADFNEWVRKNASTRHSFSYVWTGEYEIFEFDLGSTFNYAEMAALICPRPFMVERGHFDGVGEDEWVAYEFAKVRKLYQAKLGIGDLTEIEWFVGPHTINGQGTFAFLHKHLNWPKPGE